MFLAVGRDGGVAQGFGDLVEVAVPHFDPFDPEISEAPTRDASVFSAIPKWPTMSLGGTRAPSPQPRT